MFVSVRFVGIAASFFFDYGRFTMVLLRRVPLTRRSGHRQPAIGRPPSKDYQAEFDNDFMSDPIEFYRSFQALHRGRAITGVLTFGMACVEYGIQQNTKDTDWIVAPGDIGSLVSLFGELERGVSGGNWRVSYRGLFGAPLDSEYLDGGWTSHLAAFDCPESAERHLDFFGRPPRIGEAWRTDAVAGIASRDIVARMKKTDRPKDWPLVNALAIQSYYSGDNWVGPGRGRKSTRPGASGVVELFPFEFLGRLADLVPPPRKHRHRPPT